MQYSLLTEQQLDERDRLALEAIKQAKVLLEQDPDPELCKIVAEVNEYRAQVEAGQDPPTGALYESFNAYDKAFAKYHVIALANQRIEQESAAKKPKEAKEADLTACLERASKLSLGLEAVLNVLDPAGLGDELRLRVQELLKAKEKESTTGGKDEDEISVPSDTERDRTTKGTFMDSKPLVKEIPDLKDLDAAAADLAGQDALEAQRAMRAKVRAAAKAAAAKADEKAKGSGGKGSKGKRKKDEMKEEPPKGGKRAKGSKPESKERSDKDDKGEKKNDEDGEDSMAAEIDEEDEKMKRERNEEDSENENGKKPRKRRPRSATGPKAKTTKKAKAAHDEEKAKEEEPKEKDDTERTNNEEQAGSFAFREHQYDFNFEIQFRGYN